jgi:hypothetical protein
MSNLTQNYFLYHAALFHLYFVTNNLIKYKTGFLAEIKMKTSRINPGFAFIFANHSVKKNIFTIKLLFQLNLKIC